LKLALSNIIGLIHYNVRGPFPSRPPSYELV
jgi:hypothetical protein